MVLRASVEPNAQVVLASTHLKFFENSSDFVLFTCPQLDDHWEFINERSQRERRWFSIQLSVNILQYVGKAIQGVLPSSKANFAGMQERGEEIILQKFPRPVIGDRDRLTLMSADNFVGRGQFSNFQKMARTLLPWTPGSGKCELTTKCGRVFWNFHL